jgi:hypothetical protein
MGNTEYLIGAHKWSGLKSIGMVESQRELNGKVSLEERYYILSIDIPWRGNLAGAHPQFSILNSLSIDQHWHSHIKVTPLSFALRCRPDASAELSG